MRVTSAVPALAHKAWRRPRWVIAELDVRGEIDGHAAMCLRQAIEGARASPDAMILVDLCDLTSIDAAGLDIFVQANASCRSSGVQLELLISGHERHDVIAAAFNAAGLVDQLQFTSEPRTVLPARTGAAIAGHAGRVWPAARRRFSAARFRRSNAAHDR